MRYKNTILEKNQNILGLLNLQYISNSSIIFKFPVSVAYLYIVNNVDGFRNIRIINRINDTSNFYISKRCKLWFFQYSSCKSCCGFCLLYEKHAPVLLHL